MVNFESSEHATLVHAEPRTRGTRYSGTGWVCIYHWKSERTFCWHPNFSMNFIQMLTFNEFNSKANSINFKFEGIREWISNSMVQNKENAENANVEWISNSRSPKIALTDDYLLAFSYLLCILLILLWIWLQSRTWNLYSTVSGRRRTKPITRGKLASPNSSKPYVLVGDSLYGSRHWAY